MSRMYTDKELAEMLNFSYGHIRRLAAKNPERLPKFYKIGKCRRYAIEDVEEFLQRHVGTTSSTDE